MIPEQIKNSELDKLVRNVLTSSKNMTIPAGLSERTFRKIERKVLLRELILELTFKVGLSLGCLAILTGVLVWTNGSSLLTGLYTHISNNWQIISSLLFLVLITILIDQVGLKFYYTLKKEVSLK